MVKMDPNEEFIDRYALNTVKQLQLDSGKNTKK